MRYELTDFEWKAIKPFLPNKPRGVAPPTHNPKIVVRRALISRVVDVELADRNWFTAELAPLEVSPLLPHHRDNDRAEITVLIFY